MEKIAVIAGVAPGLGDALARKFVQEGCHVALLSRSSAYINNLSKKLRDSGRTVIPIQTDITEADQVAQSFARIREVLGDPDILVHNAGNPAWGSFANLTAQAFEGAWRVCALGGFLCSKQVVPGMVKKAGGTLLFTGATSAVRGRADALAFSSAKFATRGLAASLAREIGPHGIHVAHVIIDGIIDTPGIHQRYTLAEDEPLLQPDAIANTYWALIQQERSAWTFEVDIRPHNEAFFT